MSALQLTGERQIATNVEDIADDHRKRYQFAAEYIEDNFDGISIRVLDAACGNGYGSYILALDSGAYVLGLDIDQDAIDCANEYYRMGELIEFEKIDFVTQPLPDEYKYDCIVCFETLEHLMKPEELLQKFLDLSSYLICSVPNEDVLPYDQNSFPYHFKHYTVDELQEFLEENGWEPIEWFTQYSKQEGDIYEADDGRTHVVVCKRK